MLLRSFPFQPDMNRIFFKKWMGAIHQLSLLQHSVHWMPISDFVHLTFSELFWGIHWINDNIQVIHTLYSTFCIQPLIWRHVLNQVLCEIGTTVLLKWHFCIFPWDNEKLWRKELLAAVLCCSSVHFSFCKWVYVGSGFFCLFCWLQSSSEREKGKLICSLVGFRLNWQFPPFPPHIISQSEFKSINLFLLYSKKWWYSVLMVNIYAYC